ncbi:glucose-6-phosphate dehydrogenase [Biformimicrobium ophioploci]|uniref:Glucose-6-phosphate 1-dehydrogenase n=1 Tax=Biformimicrobium ophioploci TaxID=3036711 RepID=A0ABQ6LWS8_9GAMM|nr:glucose-6-phosphate dehydrogenase [Microbulbifer sp. NKW57]GMG86524.1 glucose-6-phosphate dehydrogenase [Microbulbifer sp. NKW57]
MNAFDIVLFGGAGDLALRKLLPALYRACREGNLPGDTRVIATSHREGADAEYPQKARDALKEYLGAEEYNQEAVEAFMQRVHPVTLDIREFNANWQALAELMPGEDRVRVFYLAIPPAIYGHCCENLSRAGLVNDLSRVVVEKPIGYDGESAGVINDRIAEFFPEKNIFRIDHYLGKETVQNLMALRFSNVLFEHLWDAQTIDHIQITIAETVGLEGRAGFYNEAGALRDMVQNHLLQLLCLIAMESPSKMSAKNIRAEKIKVLEALRPLVDAGVDENTVRGQYVAGELDKRLVPGYLEELGQSSSRTETFVALRAHIDNWRWSQVPFYLRTGKRMHKRMAEIVIQYKPVSHRVYDQSAGPVQPNRLIIRLQPEESIQLVLTAKKLDKLEMELQPVSLNLNFADAYGSFKSDAYKRLILDVAADNPALFLHREEVEAAWAWVDPIIRHWHEVADQPNLYRAGSWGPKAAEDMMRLDGRAWKNL